MGHEVMILKVPGMTKVSCAEEMRDYVLECLQLGLLILGQDVSWEFVDVPDLGGVTIFGADVDASQFINRTPPGPTRLQPDPPAESDPDQSNFMGRYAAEKRAVYDRLLCFRQARGLGCLRELVGGDLTETMLRSALLGEKLTIGDWRLIDQALARAEG